MLTKEPCLCHGMSGNALATGDPAHRDTFLVHATERRIRRLVRDGRVTPSDHPAGLWTGMAGRAWAWAMADRGGATLLAYNDI
ncbi:hypothetical protein F5148DRAFT_1194511 [Russula earlei]|uniref:Uncharacterized protein n=1 Tax=Russula earlei TaxID=71964 RepID=A0ACC0UC18_9AGAM|nr:hypothetical protein F5148DRAFT_1194511 [Russula earlei]